VSGNIQKELKQGKPFGSKHENAFLAVMMLAEQLESEFNELFKSHDLTASQYNVLRILRGAGEQGRSCSEIGERMITRDSDITRMLDRLEARGLIRRERQTDDRRVVLAFISPKGSSLLKDLDTPVSELHIKQLEVLSEKELDKLIALLEKVRKPRE
jgi:DNA-binding MarR family transcriptional regulator